MSDIENLLSESILESQLQSDTNNKNYTIPRSYGVYEITSVMNGRRFRFGNHPVRETELIRQFENIKRIALFLEREKANALASLLNQWNYF